MSLTALAADPVVEVEERVSSYTNPDNGSGPLWCKGAPLVVRRGDDVYVSVLKTLDGVAPYCNTRWQIWRRDTGGWKLWLAEQESRQREPCPIGQLEEGLVLSANPSLVPPGIRLGPCRPLIIDVDLRGPSPATRPSEPRFVDDSQFFDHSYRGLATDPAAGQVLLMHEDRRNGAQHVSLRDRSGRWRERGTIAFPIRACYPQVSLTRGAAHVLAIGDIVEPVDEWRKVKAEVLKRGWDYVFRRLFYTWTPDIERTPFSPPLEIDTVDATGGHISNLDQHVDDAGIAHLLYIKRPFEHDFLRDRYFPGEPMALSLEYVRVRDGTIISRRTLVHSPNGARGLVVAHARFHVMRDGALYVVLGASGQVDGNTVPLTNYVLPLDRDNAPDADAATNATKPARDVILPRALKPIPLQRPFRNFFTATPRGGSKPCDTLDLFGLTAEPDTLRYARVRLRSPAKAR